MPAKRTVTAPKKPSKKPSEKPAPQPRIVLVAVTGLSPAILTETVWELATRHQILPDRVVLITTTEGKRNLEKQLFSQTKDWGGKTVWDALRAELNAPDDKLMLDGYRIMTGKASRSQPATELEDIRSDDDNAAAADFILNQIRTEVHSSDLLIASIAGGRKTMGTLLYASMSLVARPQDWVTHVIVNAPFDGKLHPDFYFKPANPKRHEKRHPKTDAVISEHFSDDADIQLAKIPFVPLSNRFKELDAKEQPSTFLETVSRIARQEVNGTPHVASLAFDHDHKTLIIDGNIRVEMENTVHLSLLNWLCSVQEEPWLPKQTKKGIFLSAVQFCRKWHGMSIEAGQIDTDWHDNLKKLKQSCTKEAPSWVENLDSRDFTKVFARIREYAPNDHPWKQLPEMTLKLPPFKIVL